MVFRATLYSSGGLVDGYTVIKADDVSEARALAEEWGRNRAKLLNYWHYHGYVKLVMEIDKITIIP